MFIYLAQVFPVDVVNAGTVTSLKGDIVSWGLAFLGAWVFIHGLYTVLDMINARENRLRNEAQSAGVQHSMNVTRFNNRFDERWK